MSWADLTDVDWSRHPRAAAGLNQLDHNVAGRSTVRAGDMELYSDAEKVLRAITRDIDSARPGASTLPSGPPVPPLSDSSRVRSDW